MSADILERLDFMLISRRSDEDAIIRDARAEIVRLRGEVSKWRTRFFDFAAAREEELASIAPAEAKDPAPAMPNGVEASPANCRERLRLEGRPYPRSGCAHCKLGGLTGCPYEKGVHNSGRAADNRDAAGVCDCPGIGKADKTLHAPNCPVRTAPAAVPAGEAVALYQLRKADGSWIDQSRNSYDYNMANGHADDLRIVYTTPPAPVQAAPQEGECAWDYDEDTDAWNGTCGSMWQFTAGDPDDNDMHYCPKCGKRCALQHRGDSQEVGRG